MQTIHIMASADAAAEAVAEFICVSGGAEGEALDECIHDEDVLHEAEELVHIVEDELSANPILPATNELIWGSLSFLVLLFLLAKFAFPAVKEGMEARTRRIQEQVDEADRARAEVDTMRSEYEQQLANAKAEAARIMEEARQQADEYRAQRERQLDTDLSERRQQAAADLDAQKAQALAELRHQVAELAVSAAGRVVNSNLDSEANRRIVDDFITSVGSTS